MLRFLWTTPTLVFSAVILVITAGLCFWSWQRSGFSKGMGILEFLRFALVGAALATLNQPEWIEEVIPEERPMIAVLYDESGSMKTKDVVDPAKPAEPPKARDETIKSLLNEEMWKSVDQRMDVVIESFASDLPNPAEATDINAALGNMLDKHPTLRGVVLVSDGDWNIGESPSTAATRLRARKVPVYAMGVGAESRLPDIELLSLDAPTSGVPNKSIRIPFVIRSAMARDYKTTITLETSDGESLPKEVTVPAMGRLRETIEWRPKKTGEFKLSMTVPEAPGELLPDNNSLTVPIKITEEALKVLILSRSRDGNTATSATRSNVTPVWKLTV